MRSPQARRRARELSHDGRHARAARGDRRLARAPARACTRSIRRPQVLPVLGSREALFAFAQTVDRRAAAPGATVVVPNPFYQIYEGAALLAGARAVLRQRRSGAPASRTIGDGVPDDVWARTQLLYVCSPDNPTGRVLDLAEWRELFALSDRHGFVIASDECYSEIYFDEAQPPLGALAAAQALGRDGYPRLVVFGSLSKRSNAPGLALRLRRRRRGADQGVPAVPHVSRLGDVGRGRRGQHRRVERRGARASPIAPNTRRSSPRCSRGSRRRCPARCPTPRSTCGRRRRSTTPSSRGGCSPRRTSPCCPAAIVARDAHGVNPGARPHPASRSSPTPRRVRRGDRAHRRAARGAASADRRGCPAPAGDALSSARRTSCRRGVPAAPRRRPRMRAMATLPPLPRR